MEIWRQNLPAEVSLNREIERLLKICPTQDSVDRNMEQVKTKRIIEQQQKDDKMKRPYGNNKFLILNIFFIFLLF